MLQILNFFSRIIHRLNMLIWKANTFLKDKINTISAWKLFEPYCNQILYQTELNSAAPYMALTYIIALMYLQIYNMYSQHNVIYYIGITPKAAAFSPILQLVPKMAKHLCWSYTILFIITTNVPLITWKETAIMRLVKGKIDWYI